MRMLISGFSPPRELGTKGNQKISGYNRIRVDGWKRSCGRGSFRIRKKNICGEKISGYEWTWWPCMSQLKHETTESMDFILALAFSFCAGLIPFWLFFSFHYSLEFSICLPWLRRLSPRSLCLIVPFYRAFVFVVRNFFSLFLLNLYVCGPIQSFVASTNLLFIFS